MYMLVDYEHMSINPDAIHACLKTPMLSTTLLPLSRIAFYPNGKKKGNWLRSVVHGKGFSLRRKCQSLNLAIPFAAHLISTKHIQT